MKITGGFSFPTSVEEAKDWQPIFRTQCLHWRVMMVAKTRCEGAWKCYCTPVPGVSHDAEVHLWQRDGTQVEEKFARVLFPEFDDLPYAR